MGAESLWLNKRGQWQPGSLSHKRPDLIPSHPSGVSVLFPGWTLRTECLGSNPTSTTCQPGVQRKNVHFSAPQSLGPQHGGQRTFNFWPARVLFTVSLEPVSIITTKLMPSLLLKNHRNSVTGKTSSFSRICGLPLISARPAWR